MREDPFEDVQCNNSMNLYRMQRDVLQRRVDYLISVLKEIEYIKPDDSWYDGRDHIEDWLFDGLCPWCFYKKGDGHYPDCPIGEILEIE